MSALGRFFSGYRTLAYKKGEVVVRAGDETNFLFLVNSGCVRQYSVSAGGEELSLYLYQAQTCFFLPWVFGVRENLYYFEAMTAVTTWRAPRDEVAAFLQREPKALLYLSAAAFIGLTVLMTHMESLVYGNARQKIASVLLILATWFGTQVSTRVLITLPLTHRVLATMVGLTRETMTRELMAFTREGIIRRQGQNFIVVRMEKLRAVAEISLDYIDTMVPVTFLT